MNMSELRDRLATASREVSPFDTMYHEIQREDKSWYFTNAQETFTFLNMYFGLLGKDLASFRTVLDYGSGFGRLTRYFVALFGADNVIACDTSTRAVDFVTATLGCIGTYAQPPFNRIEFPKKAELIFAGSLFTHISLAGWREVLDLFAQSLSPGGYVVMTTAGEHVVRDLQAGGRRFGIGETEAASLASTFDREGFAFAGYPDGADPTGRKKQAGRCVASNAWVSSFVERETPFRVKAFLERGWSNRQDIYVLSCR